MFTIAHIFYITAFGFKPFRLVLGIVFFIVLVINTVVSLSQLKPSATLSEENIKHLKLILPIYGFQLYLIGWRSISRLSKENLFYRILAVLGKKKTNKQNKNEHF